jgi:hydroxymethylpyrimidine pyrophosphatase-like HAD family hydrolase
MIQSKPTIFCDIDGTLVVHQPLSISSSKNHQMILLPETIEKITEWDRKGYKLILVTGRKECMRKATEKQLASVGIFYDQLIMGVGGGVRYLINDRKPNGDEACFSISLDRNTGVKDINI